MIHPYILSKFNFFRASLFLLFQLSNLTYFSYRSWPFFICSTFNANPRPLKTEGELNLTRRQKKKRIFCLIYCSNLNEKAGIVYLTSLNTIGGHKTANFHIFDGQAHKTLSCWTNFWKLPLKLYKLSLMQWKLIAWQKFSEVCQMHLTIATLHLNLVWRLEWCCK